MKILIVEDQLIDGGSHHLGQIGDLVRFARSKWGATVDVLANNKASSEALSELAALPCLSGVSRGRARGVMRGVEKLFVLPFRVLRNAAVISKRLVAGGPYDVLLVPTAWTPHVVSLLLVRMFAGSQTPCICMQFLCCWDASSARGQAELTGIRLLLKGFRFFHPRLVLFGQTPGVCEDLRGKGDLRVEWMPDVAAEAALASTTEEPTKNLSADRSQAEPIVFGFYGFARHEQGVDVLQDAVALFLSRNPQANVIFNIFWPSGDFALPDGRLIGPRGDLENTGKVVFFRKPVSPEDTLNLLRRTDWVLAPYRKASYAKRSSLLATNALCLGIRAIYTEGTFLQSLYEDFGVGIIVPDGDVEALAQAIERAVVTCDEGRRDAEARRQRALKFFSADRFWSAVLS